jgi:putative transposase
MVNGGCWFAPRVVARYYGLFSKLQYKEICSMHYPQRKALRLQGYDYTSSGAYFVTICQQNRECLFGTPTEDGIALTAAGEMVATTWQKLPAKFLNTELDYFVVMPNHFHAIVTIEDTTESKMRSSLSVMVEWFKTMTITAYIRGVKKQGWLHFNQPLWQRSYYDRIIRSESALNTIREYILFNPSKWREDEHYR